MTTEPTTDDDVTTNPRMFRALAILETQAKPLLFGREPFWRSPITPPSRNVLVPSWTWRGVHSDDDLPEGDRPITIDINGAFLAALGAVEVAHAHLINAGPVDANRFQGPRYETSVWPGYYEIEVPHWAFSGTIVHPLGTSERVKVGARVWIAHPTLVQLLELTDQGSLGGVTITDAWVTKDNRRTNFRDWSIRLKDARTPLLDAMHRAHPEDRPGDCTCEACARYAAFKEGYGAAFSMMLTGERCKTRRPDWAHAVYAQHAAASWRKAWRLSAIGPILAMGSTDEITLLHGDLIKAIQKVQPPVRWDPSGRRLGHVKEKKHTTIPESGPAPEMVMSDAFEDII